MRKKRFTEEQIHGILKESEAGLPTPELCRKYGISKNTFYNYQDFGACWIFIRHAERNIEYSGRDVMKID